MSIRYVLPLTLLLLAACGGAPPAIDTPPVQGSLPVAEIGVVSPEGDRIAVRAELAVTAEQQEIGLMGRTSVPEGTGMLFLFPKEDQLYFWMKDTLIPLDILFFAADGAFLNAETMQPCPSEQTECPIYASKGSALYALEVQPGASAQWGVGTGWTLQLPKLPGT